MTHKTVIETKLIFETEISLLTDTSFSDTLYHLQKYRPQNSFFLLHLYTLTMIS